MRPALTVASARLHAPSGSRCATTGTSAAAGLSATSKVMVSGRDTVTPENVTSIPVPAADRLVPYGSEARTGATVIVPRPRNDPAGAVTVATPGTVTRSGREGDTSAVAECEAARCGPLLHPLIPAATTAAVRAMAQNDGTCRQQVRLAWRLQWTA